MATTVQSTDAQDMIDQRRQEEKEKEGNKELTRLSGLLEKALERMNQRRQEEKEKEEKEGFNGAWGFFFDQTRTFANALTRLSDRLNKAETLRRRFIDMNENPNNGPPSSQDRNSQEPRELYVRVIVDQPSCYSNSAFSQRQNNVNEPVARAMTLVAISTTSVQILPKQYTGRVDVYFGDKDLLMPHNRSMLGIHGSVVASASLPIPQNPEEEPQLSVTLQLVGEDKEYWSHTRSASGEIALQQVQRLYLGSLVEKLLTTGRCLPMSALWHLSTTDGLPHDLQARVLISDVTDSPKGRPLLTLAAEVLAK